MKTAHYLSLVAEKTGAWESLNARISRLLEQEPVSMSGSLTEELQTRGQILEALSQALVKLAEQAQNNDVPILIYLENEGPAEFQQIVKDLRERLGALKEAEEKLLLQTGDVARTFREHCLKVSARKPLLKAYGNESKGLSQGTLFERRR